VTALDIFSERLPGFLDELRELVAIETPTGNAPAVERAVDWLEPRLAEVADTSRQLLPGYGPVLRARRPGTDRRVMLVGHIDTVWPVGSWTELWRRSDSRVFAPGVYDMKGGLLFIVELLRWLDRSGADHPTLDIVINPDEEIGSLGSRGIISEVAAANDLALVLEPTTIDGVIKLARKGSGEYRLTIHGHAAHQGVEPERGVNAVVEAALQIARMLELADPEAGTTVGPNVIHAGTASNVVPDRAELLIDVRAWTVGEQRRLDRGLAELRPMLSGSRIELDGGWNRPPMEACAESIAIFERAKAIGAGLGLDLQWVRWGGSSDANLTAAAGTPTLDGLGPVGADSHQPTESIVVDAMPARLALLAELVTSLSGFES
jgi:glutamate carboxypeptidase